MRTLAVVPIKRFELAKQRLSHEVEPDLRRRLAAAMVTDVLAAINACAAIDATVVISNEPAVGALAAHAGAAVLADSRETGQSAAALIGIEQALRDGYGRVLLLPGDCPALNPVELDQLLAEAPPAPSVVIVPDRHGTGTNALLLSPPDAMGPTFGPGSMNRHEVGAGAAGIVCEVRRPASLLLDVDTPADLAALREALGRAAGGAAATRALLDDD